MTDPQLDLAVPEMFVRRWRFDMAHSQPPRPRLEKREIARYDARYGVYRYSSTTRTTWRSS